MQYGFHGLHKAHSEIRDWFYQVLYTCFFRRGFAHFAQRSLVQLCIFSYFFYSANSDYTSILLSIGQHGFLQTIQQPN